MHRFFFCCGIVLESEIPSISELYENKEH